MSNYWDNLTQKLILNILVKVMALTDTECKKSQPRDKQYRLSDYPIRRSESKFTASISNSANPTSF